MHARDAVDWSGFLFTVIGTLLTLTGVWFTYRAAKDARARATEARAAADKAAEAASAAGRSIRERVTIGDFAAILGGLKGVVTQLEARKPESALHELRQCRQKLNELRGRQGLEDKRDEIVRVVADLAAFQNAIEMHLWHPNLDLPDVPAVSEQLHLHMDTISSWAEALRLSEPREA